MPRPVRKLQDPASLTSEKLAADVAAWLAEGNEVEHVPDGVSGEKDFKTARKLRYAELRGEQEETT